MGRPSIDAGTGTWRRSSTVGATSASVTKPDRRVVADRNKPGRMPGARKPAMVRDRSPFDGTGAITRTASRDRSTCRSNLANRRSLRLIASLRSCALPTLVANDEARSARDEIGRFDQADRSRLPAVREGAFDGGVVEALPVGSRRVSPEKLRAHGPVRDATETPHQGTHCRSEVQGIRATGCIGLCAIAVRHDGAVVTSGGERVAERTGARFVEQSRVGTIDPCDAEINDLAAGPTAGSLLDMPRRRFRCRNARCSRAPRRRWSRRRLLGCRRRS